MANNSGYVKKYDVFISYRRDGGDQMAILLHDRLVAKGFRVFLDIESLNSGIFNTKLLQVIENCTDFVVILSKGSLDRCLNEGDWVRCEIAHALRTRKNVVPIMLRDFVWPELLPYDILSLPMQNGVNSPGTEYFDATVDRLVDKFLLSIPKKQKNGKIIIAAVAALAAVACIAMIYLNQPRSPPDQNSANAPPETESLQDAPTPEPPTQEPPSREPPTREPPPSETPAADPQETDAPPSDTPHPPLQPQQETPRQEEPTPHEELSAWKAEFIRIIEETGRQRDGVEHRAFGLYNDENFALLILFGNVGSYDVISILAYMHSSGYYQEIDISGTGGDGWVYVQPQRKSVFLFQAGSRYNDYQERYYILENGALENMLTLQYTHDGTLTTYRYGNQIYYNDYRQHRSGIETERYASPNIFTGINEAVTAVRELETSVRLSESGLDRPRNYFNNRLDYVFPDSSTRLLADEELGRLSAWELRVARNEIYARHGRLFNVDILIAHFESKLWYNGRYAEIPANSLNSIETENIRRIQSWE